MKRLAWIRTLFLIVLLGVALAACDTGQPPPITVVVPITAVDDTVALENAVNEALTATAVVNFGETATVVAQGGVTYTPSATFTPSITPTPTPTRFITSTPTPRPTETPTATFAPIDTNTPQPAVLADTAWIRVLHAYLDLGGPAGLDNGAPFDIYVNDQLVQQALRQGEQTSYLQVVPGTVRVTLRQVDDFRSPDPIEPIISQTIAASPGSATAVIIRNELVAEGDVRLSLLPLQEDVSPLASGRSRLTVVHSNPDLLPVNAIMSDKQQALSYDFTVGTVVGPIDVDAGSYIIDLFDTQFTDQYIASLPTIELTSFRNYIMVLSPYRGEQSLVTATWLFSGNTRLNRGEIFTRFIHGASNVGPIGVNLNQQTVIASLLPGQMSEPIPVSASGNLLTMTNNQNADLGLGCDGETFGPWTSESEQQSDKLVLITNSAGQGNAVSLCVNTLSQNPVRSAINANLRLIHMLPNTVPLVVQVRPVRTEVQQDAQGNPFVQEIIDDRNPWVTLNDAAVLLGSASDYIARVPDSYSIRIVPSGTANTLASVERVLLAAGGIYDLVVLPGRDAGSAALLVVQPQVQVTNLAINEGDPAAINEAVVATLTAAAPRVTSTSTQASTPTATPTPILTNTPRPTNTPDVLPPSVTADVLPPNQVINGAIRLRGVNFAPNRRLSVVLDSSGDEIASGTVEDTGTFSVDVTLPPETRPGPQSLSITVTRPDGVRQVVYLLILVAEARLTPSPTP